MLGAIIGAVGGLIGAKKAAKEQARAIADQNAYNDPAAIRARAEAAGFNPLSFIGPGVGLQTSVASPVMGAAIANASLALVDGLGAVQKRQAELSRLSEQNARLQKKVDAMVVRPPVPGIFSSETGRVGSIPSGVDRTVIAPHLRPLASVDPLDPRREVDNTAVVTDPGFVVLDNPALRRFAIPAIQGEVLEVDQIPTVGAAYMWDRYKTLGFDSRRILDDMGYMQPGKNYVNEWLRSMWRKDVKYKPVRTGF